MPDLSIAVSTTPRLAGVTDIMLRSIRLYPPSCSYEVCVAVSKELYEKDASFRYILDSNRIDRLTLCSTDHPPTKGNENVKACNSELICTFSADTIASPGYFDLFREYFNFCRSYPFKIGLAGVYTTGLPGIQQDVSMTAHKRHIEIVPRVIGTSWMFYKKTWQDIGGVDETFPVDLCTDDDICYRLNMAGYVNLLFPMVVLHMGRVSFATPEQANRDNELGDKYCTQKWGVGWRQRWAEMSAKLAGQSP